MSDQQLDPKSAKAELKAAKARAKAMRPWFKKKRFIFPLLLVVVIAGSIAMNGNKGTDSTSNNADASGDNSGNSSQETVTTFGIGDKAVDGKFTFTVSNVKCGIKSVGNSTLGAEAQGQFCQISLSIENTGDEPQTMFADSQKVFDSEGREFSADTGSMIYMDKGANVWLKEINPGNTLDGVLLYDVPADATLDHIELHDSVFSTGVEVSLK